MTVDGLDTTRDGARVRRQVGFIFSDADNQIVMPTVLDDVAFSLRRYKLPRAQRRAKALAMLERFGLAEHAEKSPHLLSGGQKQLLALAAVLITEPEVIVTDEPTTLLDLRNRKLIKRVFDTLDQQLIVVSHDLELFDTTDRVIYLNDGRVRGDGPPSAIIPRYVREASGDGAGEGGVQP